MNSTSTQYRSGVRNGTPWAGIYAESYRRAARVTRDRDVRAYLLGSARGCRAGVLGGRPVCSPTPRRYFS